MPSEATINEIVFGPARGGRKPSGGPPLVVMEVRELCEADLPALLAPPSANGPTSTAPTVKAIRQSHHLLARLLADGRGEAEAALISGYSPSRISILKSDPAFCELLSYYGSMKEIEFADAQGKMAALGGSMVDELLERFERDPDSFANGTLKEMIELFLVKANPAIGAAKQPSANAPLIQISFVEPPAQLRSPVRVLASDEP